MSMAENGNKVKVHYTGKLTDGTVFDSSVEREPFEFTIGQGQVIPGFENGVVGMKVSEKKDVNIPSADAYGDQNKELVFTFPKNDLPQEVSPEVGQQLQMKNQNGQIVNVIIANVDDANIYLDANHPLAGKDLNFEIELLEILS